MNRAIHLVLGSVVMAVAIVGAAVFSAWPAYRTIPPETAVLKISLTHGGARSCRQMSDAELAKLPPNMRRREICDRKRLPIHLELEIDGRTMFARSLPPSGIAGDGPSRVYERFRLPAGQHDIAVRMRDTDRDGFDYSAERTVVLAPAQNFVVDFRPEEGGFVFD